MQRTDYYVHGSWRRVGSLRRLLTSLSVANFHGWSVPLTISFDAHPDENAVEFAEKLSWPFGPKQVVVAQLHRGLRGQWMEMVQLGHDYIVLEDDVETSPDFFSWILTARQLLEKFHQHSRNRVIGICLYVPLIDEVHYPRRPWNFSKTGAPGEVYLHQLPCSWGQVYFKEWWREFSLFYRARSAPPFYDLTAEGGPLGEGSKKASRGNPRLLIPSSQSNTWGYHSWKRFMVDFMYFRGLTMLYPFPKKMLAGGFSFAHQEAGDHVKGVKVRPKMTASLLTSSEARRFLDQVIHHSPQKVAVVDLHHRLVENTKELSAQGVNFLLRSLRGLPGNGKDKERLRYGQHFVENQRELMGLESRCVLDLCKRWGSCSSGSSPAVSISLSPAVQCSHLKILDPELGEEELIKSVAAELADIREMVKLV
mmetsp:Transcript_43594/g.103594  ORF Transcript_43594/g.103594 Transcript_43594/m.103594 type:complete len:423 (-) Transcript_43594:1295-2563(-)